MKIPSLKTLLPRLDGLFWMSTLVVSVLFFAFLIWGEDGLMRLWDLQALRQSVREENKAILLENLKLTEEIESLKTMATVENIARSELGLIRSDEVILILPEPTKTAPKL